MGGERGDGGREDDIATTYVIDIMEETGVSE